MGSQSPNNYHICVTDEVESCVGGESNFYFFCDRLCKAHPPPFGRHANSEPFTENRFLCQNQTISSHGMAKNITDLLHPNTAVSHSYSNHVPFCSPLPVPVEWKQIWSSLQNTCTFRNVSGQPIKTLFKKHFPAHKTKLIWRHVLHERLFTSFPFSSQTLQPGLSGVFTKGVLALSIENNTWGSWHLALFESHRSFSHFDASSSVRCAKQLSGTSQVFT